MDWEITWCEVCGGAIDEGNCGCIGYWHETEGPADLQAWLDTGATRADFIRAREFLSGLGHNDPVVWAAEEDAIRYAVHIERQQTLLDNQTDA